MKALVMGGGMSGLATAINLLDLGLEVELIEADDMFGGRASSWLDEDGDMIDNALHVFFPYYVNLCNFFKKMGIYDNIIWKSSDFYYAQEDGKEAILRLDDEGIRRGAEVEDVLRSDGNGLERQHVLQGEA
jgi:uncharacterized protein with NAD-binding domain and iron-sulfur cluster